MRSLPKALFASVAAGGLIFSLAACSSSTPESSETPSASAAAAAECPPSGSNSDAIKVTGEFGKDLKVDFEPYTDVTATEVTTLEEGDGDPVLEGDTVSMSYAIYDGATGVVANEVGTTDDKTEDIPLDPTQLYPDFLSAFVCANVGSELAAVIPATSEEGTATVIVFKVEGTSTPLDTSTLPTSATGEPQDPEEGFPTVVLGEDGSPTITMPDAEAPTDLQVEVLKKGDGATVEEGQTVYLQYTGALWDDGTVFDSSWTTGQIANFATDAVIPGFGDGLIGQTVGSQVVIVIPPDQGYGDTESGSIPANSTLVFVVDILAVQ